MFTLHPLCVYSLQKLVTKLRLFGVYNSLSFLLFAVQTIIYVMMKACKISTPVTKTAIWA